MLTDVLHFSFTVRDIDASIDWYCDVLGLELVHRQRGDNDYTRTLVGFPDATIEIAQFRVPGVVPRRSTHVLELVQYLSPIGEQHARQMNHVGAAHLALVVDDIDREYERLRARGVEFRNPPVHITEGVNAGGAACYFSDPDGITLELLQPPPAIGLGLDREPRLTRPNGLSSRSSPGSHSGGAFWNATGRRKRLAAISHTEV